METQTTVWLSTKQLRILREALEVIQRELAGDDARAARRTAVRAALLRIERGTYGECCSCEEPIPFAVLSARPAAALCPACEEERRASWVRGLPR